jgi:multicomponent Na+:H+ antiporter subunit D
MRAAMLLFAFLCIALGVFPGPLYAMLPYPVDFVPYTGGHVVAQLQLLLFSGIAFFLLLPWLRRTLTITLDLDWLYRRLGAGTIALLAAAWSRSAGFLTQVMAAGGRRARSAFDRTAGADGLFARPWTTRTMALYVAVFLLAFLLLSYR